MTLIEERIPKGEFIDKEQKSDKRLLKFFINSSVGWIAIILTVILHLCDNRVRSKTMVKVIKEDSKISLVIDNRGTVPETIMNPVLEFHNDSLEKVYKWHEYNISDNQLTIPAKTMSKIYLGDLEVLFSEIERDPDFMRTWPLMSESCNLTNWNLKLKLKRIDRKGKIVKKTINTFDLHLDSGDITTCPEINERSTYTVFK